MEKPTCDLPRAVNPPRGKERHMSEGASRMMRQRQARSDRIRARILALIEQDGERSLDPESLRRELPGRPSAALIRYHLTVLDLAGLLPVRSSAP